MLHFHPSKVENVELVTRWERVSVNTPKSLGFWVFTEHSAVFCLTSDFDFSTGRMHSLATVGAASLLLAKPCSTGDLHVLVAGFFHAIQ